MMRTMAANNNIYEFEEYYRKLEQCYDMEEAVYSLFDLLKGTPGVDEDGFLVHQVQYRHKDASAPRWSPLCPRPSGPRH